MNAAPSAAPLAPSAERAGEQGLPPASPTASDSIALGVGSTGHVVVEGVPVPDAMLRAYLRARIARVPTHRAAILADPDVPYARVVEVMDILRDCGVTDVSFAAAGETRSIHLAPP